MNTALKKLTLQDLKIGMHVSSKQLSNIFNYYIVLINSYVSDDGTDIIGTIAYLGNEMTDEVSKYKDKDMALINNIDDTSDGEVYYDE